MRQLYAYVANEFTFWVQLLLFFYCSTFLSPRPCFFSLAYVFVGVIFGLIWRKKNLFFDPFFTSRGFIRFQKSRQSSILCNYFYSTGKE